MQIADELPLTCRIELWLPFAHVGHTADDIFRSVRFRYESFRARFDGAFHRVVWTQRRQNKHMRRIGKHAELTSGFNAIHAGHGDIHQRHVRMMSGGFVNRLASVGAGENNIEPACGIVFEDQRMAWQIIGSSSITPTVIGLSLLFSLLLTQPW